MKKKKYLFIILFFAMFLLLFIKPSYAGSQKMNQLNYEVNLNEDGSMDVVETWNIKVTDTNTLFKTFEINPSKYKGITNVSVEEIKDNDEIKKFNKINEEMYHVTKNCFYALKNSSGMFEIAWGVSIDGTKNATYKIKYTVLDAVKVYEDCNELYWKFLDTQNAIPVNKVIGTITLPSNVENKEDLKVWAHGPLNGIIQVVSNNKVTFEVEKLNAETMLEVRVAAKENIFPQSTNVISSSMLDKIISEETKWANEANVKRQMAKIIEIIINIIIIIVSIWFFTRTVKYIKKIKTVKKKVPETKVDYYREIPDETATPADASFLLFGGINQNISRILSASILDLCLKKKLSLNIEAENTEKEDIRITLNDNETNDLPESEKIIYDELKKVSNEGSFTVKEFQKYIKDNSKKFVKNIDKVSMLAGKEEIKRQNYNKEDANIGSNYMGLCVLYILIIIFSTAGFLAFTKPAGIILVCILIINAILSGILSSRYTGFTQKGINEKELWNGLKRYMLDFSLLKEREVPELVLWEKYLVYATAFGISERVINQLKIVYPQITSGELVGNYAYFNIMANSRYNLSTISHLNNAINSSYNTAYRSTYSSGSGSGGGFSGGGGGRRWRRPEWEVDK